MPFTPDFTGAVGLKPWVCSCRWPEGSPWKQDCFFLKLPVGSINLASWNLTTEGIVAVIIITAERLFKMKNLLPPPTHTHSGDFEIVLI